MKHSTPKTVLSDALVRVFLAAVFWNAAVLFFFQPISNAGPHALPALCFFAGYLVAEWVAKRPLWFKTLGLPVPLPVLMWLPWDAGEGGMATAVAGVVLMVFTAGVLVNMLFHGLVGWLNAGGSS